METPEQRRARVLRDPIAVRPYDPRWPEWFRREKEHLESCLPPDLVRVTQQAKRHYGRP